MANRWITPDNPPTAATYCRRLLIPLDVQYLAPILGALLELTYSNSWESTGGQTPDDTAAVYDLIYQDFTNSDGKGCRMIGEIIAFAGSTNPQPDNWLLCVGASLLRTDYVDLFNVIGTAFGAVDSSHFNIPDLRGRTVIGVGTGSGLSPRTLGETLGEETHQLSVAELASHVHSTGNSVTIAAVVPGEGPVLAPNPIPTNTGSTGSDSPHNNMQPSIALNYFIVAR